MAKQIDTIFDIFKNDKLLLIFNTIDLNQILSNNTTLNMQYQLQLIKYHCTKLDIAGNQIFVKLEARKISGSLTLIIINYVYNTLIVK